MLFEHRSFWLPKDVRHSGEFQDAYEVDESRGIAAIADGVASGIFSSTWAQLLTKAVIAKRPEVHDHEQLTEWLSGERTAWREPIDEENLPWFQKPKLKEGAYTTLLWVDVESQTASTGDRVSFRYDCAAIGDSCLFHLRGDSMLKSFPMNNSEEFAADPMVIGSVNRKQDHLLSFQTMKDVCEPGDMLVLATDAIAAWAIAEYEAGRNPAMESWWNLSQEMWRGMILDLRDENCIRYDDSTVVLLRMIGEPKKQDLLNEASERMTEATEQITTIVGDVKSKLADKFKKFRDRK